MATMADVQKARNDVISVELNIRSEIHLTLDIAIKKALCDAGLTDFKTCSKDIDRLSSSFTAGVFELLEKFNFVD
jgi:hypothetical protein